MIKFKMIISKDNKIGIMIRGHANYAKSGKDIVCAAVSAIVQTALLGVQRFTDTKISVCRAGHIVFTCNDTVESNAIIVTAIAGLRQIANQYSDYIEEVTE